MKQKGRIEKKIIERIKREELPELYHDLASLIGLENTVKLAKEYGGTRPYFPKLDSLLRGDRASTMCDLFDGGNYNEIAKIYNLTEIRVREIIREERARRRRQINIFDL